MFYIIWIFSLSTLYSSSWDDGEERHRKSDKKYKATKKWERKKENFPKAQLYRFSRVPLVRQSCWSDEKTRCFLSIWHSRDASAAAHRRHSSDSNENEMKIKLRKFKSKARADAWRKCEFERWSRHSSPSAFHQAPIFMIQFRCRKQQIKSVDDNNKRTRLSHPQPFFFSSPRIYISFASFCVFFSRIDKKKQIKRCEILSHNTRHTPVHSLFCIFQRTSTTTVMCECKNFHSDSAKRLNKLGENEKWRTFIKTSIIRGSFKSEFLVSLSSSQTHKTSSLLSALTTSSFPTLFSTRSKISHSSRFFLQTARPPPPTRRLDPNKRRGWQPYIYC